MLRTTRSNNRVKNNRQGVSNSDIQGGYFKTISRGPLFVTQENLLAFDKFCSEHILPVPIRKCNKLDFSLFRWQLYHKMRPHIG